MKILSWMAIGRGKKQMLINIPHVPQVMIKPHLKYIHTVPAETILSPNLSHSLTLFVLKLTILFADDLKIYSDLPVCFTMASGSALLFILEESMTSLAY